MTPDLDPMWDEAVYQILIWLRLNGKEAFTPHSGKAFIIQPKERRKPRSKHLFIHRIRTNRAERNGAYT